MKKALLFTAALVCSYFSYSQSFSVTGKVIDESDQPIAFANILLLNPLDSTFIKGTSASDLGEFRFDGIKPRKFLVQASYIGKTSITKSIEVSDDIELIPLVIDLSAEQLDEVVVASTRPKVERLQDRVVFNVENTVVAQGDSWNVLRNTPGVIVSGKDLQIRGIAATVYLNNRKVQLTGEELKTLLQGFAGSNIKSVEVISNPPANFDAEGGPVLNIITSKSLVAGYKGSLNTILTQAVFPKYSFGTSHYFKTEKLNVLANYSFNPRKEIRKTRKGINFINDQGELFSNWETNIEEIKRISAHNLTAIVDYQFDDNNSLNFTSTYVNNSNQEWDSDLVTEIRSSQGVIDSTFTTDNLLGADNTNFAIDLTFDHSFKKPGSKISLNAHFTDFDYGFNQQIASDYFDNGGTFLRDFSFDTNSSQEIKIYTGQVDYVTPVGQGIFETGAKASIIDSESSIDYTNFQGADESVNANLSDNFLYDETVLGGYLSLQQNWEKWSLKAGLRGEYTDALGTSLTLSTINNQNFFEFFPSLYVLYTASDKHSFAFDYSRGIQRPKYDDLNPFRNFSNENDFVEGNPRLFPAFSNNFNFNYTFNSELFFDLYYRNNGEYINYLVFQNNQNQTLSELKQNVLGSNSYGLDIIYSKALLNPWYVYAYVSFFHEDETFLAVESENREFENSFDGFYAYIANYLTLSKDGSLTGEVGLTYWSGSIFGSYVESENLNLTFGLRKSLWNDRAIISVAAEDLLERYVPTYTSRYFNQDNFYRRRPELQFIRFGFTYNFGNFKLTDNERSISKKERDRLESGN
ncbi:TonB-dependent receptor domain-containing protein [Croceivirga thetidis]|uniref:TonB-dependent receptor n=1 Tax=Croceivirga thetidis TaxID=2721623 RepID=A0ABX1GNV3_9FLAO|nr:TonB-dependent receptor [Croceivirga thetidis]NKI31249.1 TonB-dependent receptor [Croceivirga thetidis]